MSKFAHLSFTKIHAFTPCNNSTGYLLSQDILISSNYERGEVFMARSGVGSNRDIRQALSRAMIKPLKVTKNLGEMIVKGTLRDYASSELPALSGLFEENSELISQITIQSRTQRARSPKLSTIPIDLTRYKRCAR